MTCLIYCINHTLWLVMELYEGREGIEGLHRGLHSDYIVSRESTFGHHCFTASISSAYSPTFPSLHLRHNSFSNPSVAFPTSQFILQPFRCSTYATAHSPTLLSLLLRHRLFTYVTWRAAHGEQCWQSMVEPT